MIFRFRKRQSRRNKFGLTANDYTVLEPRQLLATVSIEAFAGRETLVIDGDELRDVARVENAGADQVQVTVNGEAESFNKSDFERIRFLGRSGDDFFENLTDIDAAAFGHGGNDELIGGNGHNWFQGGDGNDQLTGGDKNDNLRGRAGNDVIDGGKRHDRLFGSEGNDILIGAAGNDFIQGESGVDHVFGGNGNDVISGGGSNDLVDAGDGNDQIRYAIAYSAYSIIGDSTLSVRANIGDEGTNEVSNAETLQFSSGSIPVELAPTAAERVTIRPIVVSNTNGSNTAEFFGSTEQEDEIKFSIDQIYAAADIDIVWETERSWNNSFANIGNGGNRPSSDLGTIVSNGDDAGVGNPGSHVIDLYFVEIVPGFGNTADNVANGLAFISASGIAVHVGDNLVSSASGRDIVAGVVAHEIGHNLGLDHVGGTGNLMSTNGSGSALIQSQINQMINSDFSVPA